MGWFIYVLIQLDNARVATKRKKVAFSLKYWINDHWIHTTISFIGMISLIILLPDIKDRINKIEGLEYFSDMIGAARLLAFTFGLGASYIIKIFSRRFISKKVKE